MTRLLKEDRHADRRRAVSPEALARLVAQVGSGTISVSVGKEVLDRMWAHRARRAAAIVAREGLAPDRRRGRAWRRSCGRSCAANPKAVAQYRAGKTLVFGFLVGQVMKATAGKANPVIVNDLLARELKRA